MLMARLILTAICIHATRLMARLICVCTGHIFHWANEQVNVSSFSKIVGLFIFIIKDPIL